MSVCKTQKEDPVEAAIVTIIVTMNTPKIGIWLNFRIKITGTFEETEDEAEVSTFKSSIPLKSEKGLHRERGSLF
jgi:hypothetical protein